MNRSAVLFGPGGFVAATIASRGLDGKGRGG